MAASKEKQGDDRTAIMLYKKILEKNPKRVEAAFQLSELYIKNKNKAEAIGNLDSLIIKNPNNGYFNFILGKIFQAFKEPDLAVKYYKIALKNDPNLDQVYKCLVDLSKTNKNKIEILNSGIKKLPHSTEIKLMLSFLYLQENELNSAIELMELLYSGNKTNAVYANNLAWLYLENNTNINQAFELASFAYGTDSNNANFAHTLGVAFHKKRLLKQAEWYLRKALSLIDEKPRRQSTGCFNKDIIVYHLALILMDMEQHQEAKSRLLSIVGGNLPKSYTFVDNTLLKEKWHVNLW